MIRTLEAQTMPNPKTAEALGKFVPLRPPNMTDQVHTYLSAQIVDFTLPPGTKISEIDVARQLGVSRQPVRDAFFRLSQQGFLLIRPQRATLVRPIETDAILQACFVRTALEIEVIRRAGHVFTADDFAALEDILSEQDHVVKTGDRTEFHRLDDEFHSQICLRAGLNSVWDLIRANKAHMDRVRFFSLATRASGALQDHRAILDQLKAGDVDGAALEMRRHLAQIPATIDEIRRDHAAYFDPAET